MDDISDQINEISDMISVVQDAPTSRDGRVCRESTDYDKKTFSLTFESKEIVFHRMRFKVTESRRTDF